MSKHTATEARTRAARILQLVEDIGADPEDEGAFQLVECGLHSGFSACCIEFFVRAYWPVMMASPRTIKRLSRSSPRQASVLRAMEGYRTALRGSVAVAPGHVPCPQCLQDRRFVRVRRCDWHLTARERRHAMAVWKKS